MGDRTVDQWVEACAARGIQLKKVGKEYAGPCPVCGGVDRFHVGPGSKHAVVASCRHGHGFEELAAELFPAHSRQRAASGAAGRATSTSTVQPKPSEAANEQKPPPHERIWNHSIPIPPDVESPPRLWAAKRNLWRPEVPFPPSLRWRDPFWGTDGDLRPASIVACFTTLQDWPALPRGSRDTDPGAVQHVPAPKKVELVNVTLLGDPVEDLGGAKKRSHGSCPGAVLVLNVESLGSEWPVHVAEGVADGLAIAARKRGAVIVAGGTSGIRTLANDPADLVRVVGRAMVWMWADGDEPGQDAGGALVEAVQKRGGRARLMPMPKGQDPASIAPCFQPQ